MATFDAQVRMIFGQRATSEQGPTVQQYVKLRRDGSDTVADVKAKIAVCSAITSADHLLDMNTLGSRALTCIAPRMYLDITLDALRMV